MDSTPIIPADGPSIFDFVSSLSVLDNQAIIRPNNPPAGIAGFLFDIPENDELNLQSDITDHFVENNTPIQDNIALHPEEYTVRGLVAEIASVSPSQATQAALPAALPVNEFYLPTFAPGTDSAAIFAKVASDSQAATFASAQSLYSYYDNQAAQPPAQTKQAKIFGYFYQLWKGRQLFTVETPWGFWTSMAIKTIRAEQGEDSRFKSALTITFKRMRFAGSATVAAGLLAGRAANMTSPVVNNGNASKTAVTPAQSQSLLFSLLHPSS